MLTNEQLNTILAATPNAVLDQLRGSAWIAGGFIGSVLRGEQPADLDIFCTSRAGAARVAKALGLTSETANAYSGTLDGLHVQVIRRWTFRTPAACLAAFDFTLCQAAVGIRKGVWSSWTTPAWHTDHASRTLVYTHPDRKEDCAGSFLRAIKFARRGYILPMKTLAAVTCRMLRECDISHSYGEGDFIQSMTAACARAQVGISSSNA